MPTYFMGIDVSTTASKALIIDAQGNVIASQSYPHRLSTPRPLWSEQEPADWWDASSRAIREVLKSVSADDIAAIGLTGQMHGLTSLDADGNSLRPAILWNDGRSSAQCAEITERVGLERLCQLVGTRMLPGFTAPKLLWVHENEPEIYARIAHVLLPKDYLRYQLSGVYASDVADGSGFACLDVAHRRWSDEVLAACEIDRAILPELFESQAVSATVSAEGASATGLRVGTPIVGGAGDQPAGGVGSGIVSMGQVSMSMGTSGVVYAISDRYAPEPHGRLHTFCGPTPTTWFHMGVMLSASGGLRWLRDALAPSSSYAALSDLAAGVSRGAEGLLFAPYLTGERNPHPDPLARGGFVGLTLRHGLGHLVRAVMEGVAFGMRDNLELLKTQGVNPTSIVVSGGAINSPVWSQLLADIMGVPLETVNTTEGAALGAAILASVGAGAYPDVPSACAQIVHRIDRITPDAAGVAVYNRLYPVFRGVYPALRETFAELAAF